MKVNFKLLLVALFLLNGLHLFGQGWQQTYPTSSSFQAYTGCQQTFDGGYIFTGRAASNINTIQLLKVDQNGFVQWDSVHVHGSNNYPRHIIQTQDSGYAVLENAERIAKFSQNGTLLWEQPASMTPKRIIELADKSLVVCGDSGSYHTRVAKFDSIGNQLWGYNYPSWPSNVSWDRGPWDIKQTSDAGFVTIAFYEDSIRLHKLDQNGILQWTSSVIALGNFYGTSDMARVALTPDGGYAIGVSFSFWMHSRILIHKFDSVGNHQWSRFTGVQGDDYVDFISASDGGYLAVGYTYRDNYPNTNNRNFLVTKIVADGTYVEWERILADSANATSATSVNKTSDAGYIIGGVYATGGYGVKLDSLGSLGIPCGDTTYLTADICPGEEFTVGSSTYTQPGTYTDRFVTVEACDSFVVTTLSPTGFATDSLGNPLFQITGHVFEDNDGSCLFDVQDNPLTNWVVEADDGNPIYATTDGTGQYSMLVPYGNYNMSTQTPVNWDNCGPPVQSVSLDSSSGCSLTVDFPLVPEFDCALLDLDLSIICLVPCSTSTYHLNYHNIGTAAAYDPTITFVAGPFITVDWSSVPWITPQSGNVYEFHLDSVPAGASGWIAIAVTVDCDADLEGLSVCSGAIHDASQCCDTYQLYSGAQVELSAECINTDTVEFKILNTGVGDMAGDLDYFILQDDIVYSIGIFQLPSQQADVIHIPADGSTYRLEAEQEPFHPYLTAPAVVIEGCGGAVTGQVSTGFSDILDNGDPVPSIDFLCTPITADCNCNLLYGSPLGVGPEHYISADEQLEYTINFQNQGNAVANEVVIIDTLPEELDPNSIIKGEASHDFDFSVYGNGIVKWEMKNINLDPGTPGTMENSGFVKFTVDLKPGAQQGTIVTNRAEIYFDSVATATNEVFHTIGKRGEDFLKPLSVDDIKDPEHTLHVFPNPFRETTTLEITGVTARQIYIEIHNMAGQLVQTDVATNQNIVQISRQGLADGMYTYRVIADGKLIGTGKLVIGTDQ